MRRRRRIVKPFTECGAPGILSASPARISLPSPPIRQRTMEFHDRPVFPRGFRNASRNCGLKPAAKDLSLFTSDVDAAAAALFTRNHFPGAPVLLGRETIRGG